VSATWKVTGQRELPEGGSENLVSASWGSTEERARTNFKEVWGRGFMPRWTLAELHFELVAQEVSR
jgi:hypothetical protein